MAYQSKQIGGCNETSFPPRAETMDSVVSVTVNRLFCLLAYSWQERNTLCKGGQDWSEGSKVGGYESLRSECLSGGD